MLANPITYLVRKAGLSLRQFEIAYDFSHEGVMQAVVGAFQSPPPRIKQALFELLSEKGLDDAVLLDEEYGVDNLDEAYDQWRLECRREIADEVNRIDPGQLVWDQHTTPAKAFCIAISGTVTGFAKAMKIPIATVRRWADGKTEALPKSVEDALRSIEFPRIKELLEVQSIWFENWKM